MKHSPSIDALLRAHGLRRTPVRVEVLDLLQSASRPLSVPQMLNWLRGVDAVTVYRTLNTFIKKKLVHRVRGEDRSWLYAAGDPLAQPAHLHPHFVCDECGKVECLEEASIPGTFVESLHVGDEYHVAYPEVVLHGRCPKCHD
ncbi:MAG: transcriptional repressor [Phycisphaerae bacterium]|nr:transcriptional repressor [Phycisphaerae bacterium]MDW8263089.1 Fur family transcriptional regulator [Phycisphaerales bacterium]